MKRVIKATNRSRKAPRPAVSRAILLVTLLAFSLQTYLTQTHIHLASERPALLSQVQVDHGKAPSTMPAERRDRYPANEDPANCPLCQELIHAGQFLTPAAAALLLPFFSTSVMDVAVPSKVFIRAVTHVWRGRAPPLR